MLNLFYVFEGDAADGAGHLPDCVFDEHPPQALMVVFDFSAGEPDDSTAFASFCYFVERCIGVVFQRIIIGRGCMG